MYTQEEKDFLKKLKNQGYSMDEAFSKLQEQRTTTKTPGIVSNIKDYGIGVGKDIVESAKGFKDMSTGVFERAQDRFSKAVEIGKDEGLMAGGVAGGLAATGTIFDTGFTAGLELLKIVAPEKVEEATKGGMEKLAPTLQSLDTKIKDFAKTSPEAKRLVDASGLVLEGFVLPGAGTAGVQVAKKGTQEAIQTGKELIQKAPKIIESAPIIKAQDFIKQQIREQDLLKKSKETISDIGESIETRTEALKTGIPKEKIAGLQANPLQADEYTKLTQRLDSPEGIADIKDYKTERIGAVTQELTSKIDEIRAAKGETSNVYKDIRALPVQVQTDDLFNNLKTSLEKNGMKFDDDGNLMRVPGSQAKDLNSSDIAKFQQLYNDIRADAQKGYLTPNEMLTFRKTASDLAKYDGSTTTTGQGIMRSIRKDLDNTAKEQIPGLKELDSQFVDKLDELENAIRDLVYKQGDVKGEWRSNIVNIIGTLDRQNRAKLLERLEEVMPGIGERIKAIDNLPAIYQAINNKGMLEKFTGVGGAFAGSATLGAAVPGLGHVVGFVLGYVGGEMLENVITGARRVAINKVLSKISPEGFKKMKEIDLKIQNNEALRKTDKDFIDNLKLKLENETNNIEAGKTKDIDNSMGDNMTSNTDELLTSRVADSSTNNIKSVKAKVIKKPTTKTLPKTIKKPIDDLVSEARNFKKKELSNLIEEAKRTGKMPLNEDIFKGFIEKPKLLDRKTEIDKIKAIIKQETDIKDFVPNKTLSSVEKYTKHQGRINAYLRNPNDYHLDDTIKVTEDLIKELDNLPKYTGVSYRGVKSYPGLEDLKVGQIFSDKGLLSSSKSKIVADRFADEALFIIKGKSGVDLSDISKMKSEQEILFKPNSKFNIVNIETKGGKKIITLEQ